MAIQTLNLTVPGGDTPRSANTKINANFTNTTHAASRLVGTASGNVPEHIGANGLSGAGLIGISAANILYSDRNNPTGVYKTVDTTSSEAPNTQFNIIRRLRFSNTEYVEIVNTRNSKLNPQQYMRVVNTAGVVEATAWAEFYTTANTTKEAGTGYIVASSPVLKVQHDSFEKVHEAEQLDIDVQRLATGVYEITGTTGLRDNDGWYLKPPKDINGNVLCICEVTQEDGVITLKTYKKKFDFETVSIVPDYEQPTDIPDGAEVMLRFNDLPAEPMPPEV